MVLPISHSTAMVEVVPNARSREQVARVCDGNLYQYFLQTFGASHTKEFQKARACFVQSFAGYSLVSFLLQVRAHLVGMDWTVPGQYLTKKLQS